MLKLKTFDERFEYLRIGGSVGIETFGFDRYLNQALYASPEWKRLRNEIIIRDNGCDLAIHDRQIYGRIIIHHLNPITESDISNRASCLFEPDNLVCVAITTHNAIHYGNKQLLAKEPVIRRPNDTCPWR